MKNKDISGTTVKKSEKYNADAPQLVKQADIQAEATPMDLIQMAVSKDFDIEKLEKLMTLQREWKAQKALEEFNAAMSKFQSIVPDMRKNRKVDFEHKDKSGRTTYDYQDLGSIANHIREPLSACGLAYRWGQTETGGKVTVWAILSHSGGHVEKGEPLTAQADASGGKQGIHAVGSTITYLKRYTLVAILGLSSSEMDDDGRAGVALKANSVNNGKVNMTEEQLKEVVLMVRKKQVTVETLQQAYNLTPEQITTLELAEKNAKA